MSQANGFRIDFLKDGSVKITVDGEVPTVIHDATEEAFSNLGNLLGGTAERKPLAEHGHYHTHGHGHGHVHH